MKIKFFLLALIFFFISCKKEQGGISIKAVSDTVTATWSPNTESDLAGYRIHYGTKPRTYDKRVLTTDTTIVITGLTAGQTYYFAVTAYDKANNESGFSEEVSVTMPNEPPPPIPVESDTTLSPDLPLFITGIGTSKSNDPQDQNSRVLAFWGNEDRAKAWIKLNMILSDTLDFEFSARGDLALNVGPVLQIAFGDTNNGVIETEIVSTAYAPVKFNSLLPDGRDIYFLFANDIYKEGEYDRNLFIASVTIKKHVAPPFEFSKYDFDKNKVIDELDWSNLLHHIGFRNDHSFYSPEFDLNSDGWIDGIDKAIFARLSNFK